jgi:hypothetical protein
MGKTTLEFQNTTQIQLFNAYTPFTFIIKWTGVSIAGSAVPTAYSLTITLNNCVLSNDNPNVKDWNVIQEDLDFQAFASTGNQDEMTAVLVNDEATMT